MANPGDRELLGIGPRNYIARIGSGENGGIRVRASGNPPPLDDRPFEEIQKTVHARRGPWVSEPALRAVVTGK
jgi:hypothetical protein